MAVTQGDVAKLAGVARRTVSNVVNDFPHVSADVRARVQSAIAELGYQPNRAAQRLRTGRSGTIGLILPELDVGYFAEIGRLVIEEAEARGYTVLVAQTLGLEDRELEVLDKFTSQQPDGLIFSPISLSAHELGSHRESLPVVLLGEQFRNPVEDHVGIDNVAATRDIVGHLIERGRQRVAFVGNASQGKLTMASMRLRGYSEALKAAGLEVDPAIITAVRGYHRAHGFEAIRGLLENEVEFDSVFCANDLLALGAMRALTDAGLRVPKDVAVVGFDDLDDGRYSVPRLTTVSPDKQTIAREAVRLLIAQIENEPHIPQFSPMSYSIVVRESS